MTTQSEFRLFDFAVYNEKQEDNESNSDSDEEYSNKKYTDTNQFVVQMFGINKDGETTSIQISDFNPFFYIKVCERWEKKHLTTLKEHIISEIKEYYRDSIVSLNLVERNKLYGFNAGQTCKFVQIPGVKTDQLVAVGVVAGPVEPTIRVHEPAAVVDLVIGGILGLQLRAVRDHAELHPAPLRRFFTFFYY